MNRTFFLAFCFSNSAKYCQVGNIIAEMLHRDKVSSIKSLHRQSYSGKCSQILQNAEWSQNTVCLKSGWNEFKFRNCPFFSQTQICLKYTRTTLQIFTYFKLESRFISLYMVELSFPSTRWCNFDHCWLSFYSFRTKGITHLLKNIPVLSESYSALQQVWY